MSKNMVEPDRPQIIYVPHTHIACWITKAVDTHSAYEIYGNTGCANGPYSYVYRYMASFV